MQTTQQKRRPAIWFLGTRAFIANTTASGLAAGYFALTLNVPLLILILLLWLLSMVTWAEYHNALKD